MAEPIGLEVKCVVVERDHDSTERITQIGGDGWQKKLSDVVWELGLGSAAYYTSVDGERADVEVVSPQSGPSHLRTNKDDELTNNLLKLPRCSKVLPTGM